jgi:hypothetical protein
LGTRLSSKLCFALPHPGLVEPESDALRVEDHVFLPRRTRLAGLKIEFFLKRAQIAPERGAFLAQRCDFSV